MRREIGAIALAALLCLHDRVVAQHQPPGEQPQPLTLAEVLARVREQSPAVLTARARVAEAEARVAAAGIRMQENPRLEIGAGPRTGGSTDLDLGLEQPFDHPGSRAARMDGARSALARERATAEVITRASLEDAAVAFVTLLQHDGEIELLEAARVVTGEVLQAAERRYAAGDIAILDVNVARTADARARSDLRSAMAARLTTVGDLAVVLGQPPSTIRVTGNLRDLHVAPPADAEPLDAAGRPEFEALAAERREALAEIRQGDAQRKLRFGARVNYQREEGDQIVLGGLTVTLPAFNRGQDLRLAGAARPTRVDSELAAVRQATQARLEAATARLAQALAAVEALEQDALTQAEENERLARRSYEAGQISLADWLVFRREALDVRRAYLEKLRDAAIARIERDARAGVLR